MEQEFVRIGYYVNNEYDDEILKESPPDDIAYDRIVRNVLSDKPRVTRIPIKWDSTDEIGQPPEECADLFEDEMEVDGFNIPSSQQAIAPSNCAMELEVD
jgi:histone chaperone ASF1